MSSILKKIAGFAVPIANVLSGGALTPLQLGLIGAGSGLASGGGLKGALLGGAGGYIGGGGAFGGEGSLGTQLLGAGAKGVESLTQGLGGAISGAQGGLKGALMGAGAGALGANAKDIGNYVSDQWNGLTGSGAISSEDLLNAPATMSSSTNKMLTGAGYNTAPMISGGSQFPNASSKISGDKSGLTDNLLSAPEGGMEGFGSKVTTPTTNVMAGAGGGTSMTSGKLSDLLSGGYNFYNTNNQEEELLRGQREAQGMIRPYWQAGNDALANLQGRLSSGFQPGDLTQDPGYQFQLEQGNKNLNRSLGAQGSLFSGRALQAAQDYGQGLAEQTYNNAYQRWLAQNQQLAQQAGQGYTAANNGADMATTYSQTKAEADAARGNLISSGLSTLLGGNIIGYDKNKLPVYRDDPDAARKVVTPV